MANLRIAEYPGAVGVHAEERVVKNVENVQGDERDIIVFSTTFGRNEHGVFRNSFGALGHVGGAVGALTPPGQGGHGAGAIHLPTDVMSATDMQKLKQIEQYKQVLTPEGLTFFANNSYSRSKPGTEILRLL